MLDALKAILDFLPLIGDFTPGPMGSLDLLL